MKNFLACLMVTLLGLARTAAQEQPAITATHGTNVSPERIVADHIIKKIEAEADGNKSDPLLLDAKKLREPKGLKTIGGFLAREGKGDVSSMDKLFQKLDEQLTPEAQEKMRSALELGKPTTQSCPYIGCALHICHC